MRKALRNAFLLAVLVAGLILLAPHRFGITPNGWRGWAIYLLFGFPPLLVGEVIGARLSRLRVFGLWPLPLRIAFGVSVCLAVIAAIYFLAQYLGSPLQSWELPVRRD